MRNFLVAVIGICCLVSCKVRHAKLNVSADYISIFFPKDQNNPAARWEDMRKMPRGAFTCNEQDNGDLLVKYNPKDSITTFVNVSADSTLKKCVEKLPKSRSSLQLKGIYMNPTEPFDFFHAFYFSKSDPNTICIVSFSAPAVNIIGATYYSNQQKNLVKEENIRF
ncbi:hypothetical protein [Chitinophaga sp.]|uniref:hypothetical protein n=1 Tax=Chitinophaga sp. TaxID=1869181 RepID=UPI0031D2533F